MVVGDVVYVGVVVFVVYLVFEVDEVDEVDGVNREEMKGVGNGEKEEKRRGIREGKSSEDSWEAYKLFLGEGRL